MPKPFNPRHQMFIDNYIVTGHGTQSAIVAGYSEKTARSQASTLLTNPNIVKAIADGIKEKSRQFHVDADYVKNETVLLHRRATLAEPLFDSKGNQVSGLGYDPNTAHKALKLLGEHKDVQAFDNTLKHIGDLDQPIGVVSLNATDRAARIANILKNAMVEHEANKDKK